jgi:hypothetical protein
MLRIVYLLLLIVDSMDSYLDTLCADRFGAFAAVDPDDVQTAICFCCPTADGFRVVDLVGGGSARAGVAWGSVTGALTWLRAASEGRPADEPAPTLVVEAQAFVGAHSDAVEGCRRARWHWDAAAELAGWSRVHAFPADWQGAFVPAGSPWRIAAGEGPGAIKRAYQLRARELDPRAINEDRCAALGIAWWYARSIGSTLLAYETASAMQGTGKVSRLS